MLDYLSEIMEDANDFSWQSAKASQAVLLCRMEEGKLNVVRPLKLIILDGRMHRDSLLKTWVLATPQNLKQSQLFVVFIIELCIKKIGTMKQGVPFIGISVQWGKITGIWPKMATEEY